MSDCCGSIQVINAGSGADLTNLTQTEITALQNALGPLFTVNAGTTPNVNDDANGSATITFGEIMHLWNSAGLVSVVDGSVIINLDALGGAGAELEVAQVTAADVGTSAVAGAEIGIDPATGALFYVDSGGLWQAITVSGGTIVTTSETGAADQTQDFAGFNQTWNNVGTFDVNLDDDLASPGAIDIDASLNLGGQTLTTEMDVAAGGVSIEHNPGSPTAINSELQVDGSPRFGAVGNVGVEFAASGQASHLGEPGVRVLTPDVVDGVDVTGRVLAAVDATGEVEFLGSIVNEVIQVDDQVTTSVDLPEAGTLSADIKLIDVCEITNPAPQVASAILGGDVTGPASIFVGSFVPSQTGTYTLEIVSVDSMNAGNAWFTGGTAIGVETDLFDLSADPYTSADVGTKTWSIPTVAGQQVFLFGDADAGTVVEQPLWRVTGFTPQSVPVTANGGAQPIAGDVDSRNWQNGDKILAIPTKVVDSSSIQSFSQPDNAANSVTAALVPGVVELQRGASGGIYNIVSEASWSGGSSPADTEWRNNTVTTFTNFSNAYSGQIGDNILTPAYGGAQVRVISTGQIFNIEFSAWQQGGGGGFAFTASDATKVDGWCLIKIPKVGVDFQADNWATGDLTVTGGRNHDFAGNIVRYSNVFQHNWSVLPQGSVNWSLPTQAGVGTSDVNIARTAFSATVNDLFNAGAQPTTFLVGQNNSGFRILGNRPSDGGSVNTGLTHSRSTQPAYPNLTGIRAVTPGLANQDANVGDVFTLVDATTGEGEWQPAGAGGAATNLFDADDTLGPNVNRAHTLEAGSTLSIVPPNTGGSSAAEAIRLQVRDAAGGFPQATYGVTLDNFAGTETASYTGPAGKGLFITDTQVLMVGAQSVANPTALSANQVGRADGTDPAYPVGTMLIG